MSVLPSYDRLLPSRIKKYAETRSFIDPETMAEDLQKHYKHDYGRRKKIAFRKLVLQVYQDMIGREELDRLQVKRKKSNPATVQTDGSSDDYSDDMKMCYEYEDTNMMNQSLSSMYNKKFDSSPRMPPSQNPQFYDNQINDVGLTPQQHQSGGSLGWFIDRGPGNKKIKVKPNRISNNGASSKSQDQQDASDKLKDTKSSNPVVEGIIQDNGVNISAGQHISESQIITTNNILKENDNVETDTSKGKRKRDVKSKKNSEIQTKKNKIKKSKKVKEEEEVEDSFVPGKKTFTLQTSDVTFDNVAGNNGSLQDLARLLLHMSHPEIYTTLGVSPPRGVLLHGPPGCGKTLLGNAIAGQLNLPLLRLVGPELVGGVSGESERRVRDVFDTAIENAPCVLFLDEIDAVAQRRDNSSKEMERRIVAQLLSCLDDLNKNSHQVMVIGATNRPDSLDPALRRAGRFDREICLGIPDEKARCHILKVLCKELKLGDKISFELIARITPGYVGADLMSLCREAAMQAVTRILMTNKEAKGCLPAPEDILEWLRDPQPFPDDQLDQLTIESKDFELAVLDVQPSAKREGFATVPDVTWDDIGALESVRDELSIAILGPVRNPTTFAALGLSRASGVLLAGPPGCGKTLLAKAIANESGINFVSVKGPELLNMYVGESERAVRQCFERARNSAPCVIFFDELDSLCPRRSSVESGASARVVNQMLTELDGLESRKQVFVMAATNRPDIIDPAVLRPGRLDKTLFIGIPSPEDRVKILQTLTKNGTKPPMTPDVDLRSLGMCKHCEGFTGADLSALVREAALNAIRSNIDHKWNNVLPSEHSHNNLVRVSMQNFNDAFCKVSPSISKTDFLMYEDMRKKLERS